MPTSELHSISHPKTVTENLMEEGNILRQADKALHSAKPSDQQAAVAKLSDELNAMTPVERMHVGKGLSSLGESLKDSDTAKPKEGLSSVPLPKLTFDQNGDIKSFSFKSVSDDKDFGKTVDINLAGKRKDEGPGAQVIKLADGSREVVHRDKDGSVASVQDSSGLWIERNKDGKTWSRTDHNGGQDNLSDLSISDDGALHYSNPSGDVTGSEKVGAVTESVSANGDRNFTSTVTAGDGRQVKVNMATHEEYPNTDVSKISQTTVTNLDTGKSAFERTTDYMNGDKAVESPQSRQTFSADGKTITIQNMDSSGKVLPGMIIEHKEGSMDVTFPDGTGKHYNDLSKKEWDMVARVAHPKIQWKTVNGDPHHFAIQVDK